MNGITTSRGLASAGLRCLVAVTLAAGASQAMALGVTLCAEPYSQSLPGAGGAKVAVPMWGYRQAADAAACASGAGVGTASPGPVLTVPAGETSLTITLVNRLTVPTSIVIAGQPLPTNGTPGPVHAVDLVGAACDPAAGDVPTRLACRVRSFTGETAPGASSTYTFANLKPGTYLYQSGTHPQVQVQMGLFGMARQDAVLSGTGGSAGRYLFANAAAGFEVDVPVVLSEIDPVQHTAIAATLGSADPTTWKAGKNSTLNYAPGYFLINGQVFDAANPAGSDLALAAPAGSRVVLRVANAGLRSRILALNNGTWKLLTEDANPYAAPREQATVLLPANKTSDALLVSTAPADGTVSRRLAVFDRRGGTDNGDGSLLGGQVARLAMSAPVTPFINPIAAQVVNEGTAFALQVQGTNINGYTLAGEPAGMTISAAGLIAWAAPLGTPVPTNHAVGITGSGTGGAPVTRTFAIRVNHTPTIVATGPVAVSHGTVTVPAPGVLAGATDPDLDVLQAVLVGAAANPSAGTLSLAPNGGYTWSGPQPAAAPATAVTFTVASRDAYGLVSTPKTITLNVAPNAAPVAVAAGTFAAPKATITLAGTALQKLSLAYQLNTAAPSPLKTAPFTNWAAVTDADGTLAPTTFTATVVKVRQDSGALLGLGGCGLFGGAPTITEATATVAGDGTLTFTPRTCPGIGADRLIPPNNVLVNGGVNGTGSALGTYRITYTVKDDQGASSNVSTIFVRVQ